MVVLRAATGEQGERRLLAAVIGWHRILILFYTCCLYMREGIGL